MVTLDTEAKLRDPRHSAATSFSPNLFLIRVNLTFPINFDSYPTRPGEVHTRYLVRFDAVRYGTVINKSLVVYFYDSRERPTVQNRTIYALDKGLGKLLSSLGRLLSEVELMRTNLRAFARTRKRFQSN